MYDADTTEGMSGSAIRLIDNDLVRGDDGFADMQQSYA